jgi:signal peptidase I
LTDTPAASPEPHQQETVLESLASICVVLAVGLFVMYFVFQNFEIPSGSMENTLLIGDHVLVDRETLAPPAHWAPFVHYREVRRGDVIVFLKPHPESPDLILVKRAIAIPGDRIHLRNGIVYLNGVAQNEPYAINPTQSNYVPYRDNFPSDLAGLNQEASDDFALRGDCHESPAPDQPCIDRKAIDQRTIAWASELPKFIQGDDLVVPPGVVFAMGDNRTQSLDGRFWGFVPRENILGRPMFVYWSFQTPPGQNDKSGIGDRIAFMGHILLHLFDQTRWSRTFHIIR